MKIPKPLLEAWTRIGKQALALAVAWVVLFAPSMAAAQEKSQPQKAVNASRQQAAAKPSAKADNGATKSEPSGGPREGITVHGHWVIDIRNADGTLASHHEFENALTYGPVAGNDLLSRLLTRQVTVGQWYVSVSGANGPCGTSSAPKPCILQEDGSPGALPGEIFFGLKPSVDAPSTPTASVQLKGNATAGSAGQISSVSTWQFTCAPSVAPAACGSSPTNFFAFTAQDLATPIAVQQAGQIIQVTVKFSF
jgi:hypothetical protein